MPTIDRRDEPGALHHVMNRGVDHAVIFAVDEDYATFCKLLEDIHKRGLVAVHAYCLMDNHFHLLLQSRAGRLSDAMQVLGYNYAAAFNERTGRDGPLFRGRFRSIRVTSDRYLLTLVRYIDLNPVRARLVGFAGDHPHGSARHYLAGTGPAWLTRDLVLELLSSRFGADEDRLALYRQLLEDPDDDADSGRVESSLERGLVVPMGLEEFSMRVAETRRVEGGWLLRLDGRVVKDCLLVATVGIMHSVFGRSLNDISRHVRVSANRARRIMHLHTRLVSASASYRRRIGRLLRDGPNRPPKPGRRERAG